MKTDFRGFTLIEMLVTIVIFMIVMIAVLSLYDQGQWVYLHSSRRANAQEHARLALEQLERDVRMSGFGVPTGAIVGGTDKWTPALFQVGGGKIYFRSDLDNGHSWVKMNVAVGDTKINVEEPDLVCPQPNITQIILVDGSRTWEPFTCTGADSVNDTITVDTPTTAECLTTADECEVSTVEHIFYRLSGDADNNGICDNSGYGADPFCSIQRAIVYGNDPTTNSVVPADSGFETLATNVVVFDVQNSAPLRITIDVKERAMQKPGQYQTIRLTSEISVRDGIF